MVKYLYLFNKFPTSEEMERYQKYARDRTPPKLVAAWEHSHTLKTMYPTGPVNMAVERQLTMMAGHIDTYAAMPEMMIIPLSRWARFKRWVRRQMWRLKRLWRKIKIAIQRKHPRDATDVIEGTKTDSTLFELPEGIFEDT